MAEKLDRVLLTLAVLEYRLFMLKGAVDGLGNCMTFIMTTFILIIEGNFITYI